MAKHNHYLSIFFICALSLTACNPFHHSQSAATKHEPQAVKQQNPGKTATPVKNSADLQTSIKQIADLALLGRVPSVEFAAHNTTITYVEKIWGPAAKTDKVENIYYANYPSKHTVLGYNDKKVIVDVRSYDPNLHKITFVQIKKELGPPTYIRSNQSDQIYGYKLNNQFELKFVMPSSTGTVDHISVYSPNDTNVAVKIPPYILPIKGVSNNMSATAWASMQVWRNQMLPVVQQHPNQIYLNGPNRKMVALTFDDGPDNLNTPKIIETLAKYHVKGNFFFIGEKVRKFPSVAKEAYNQGNLVLSHSYYHNDLSKETSSEIKADLALTEKAFSDVIGIKPALLRPPYGAVNNTVISTGVQNGYKEILWSIDTLDWSQKESSNIENNVLKNIRNGDIILMHSNEDKAETAKALPNIIEGLKQRGFEIVTLQTLLNVKPYK